MARVGKEMTRRHGATITLYIRGVRDVAGWSQRGRPAAIAAAMVTAGNKKMVTTFLLTAPSALMMVFSTLGAVMRNVKTDSGENRRFHGLACAPLGTMRQGGYGHEGKDGLLLVGQLAL